MPFLHWEKEPASTPTGPPEREPAHVALRKESLRLTLVQYYYPFLNDEELKERGHQVVAEEQKEEQKLVEDQGGQNAENRGEILVVDELFLWLTCKKEPCEDGSSGRFLHKYCPPMMRNLLRYGKVECHFIHGTESPRSGNLDKAIKVLYGVVTGRFEEETERFKNEPLKREYWFIPYFRNAIARAVCV